MGTDSTIPLLAAITVVTKHLQGRIIWEASTRQLEVNSGTASDNFGAVLSPIIVDMVQSQEQHVGFAATLTIWPSIRSKCGFTHSL